MGSSKLKKEQEDEQEQKTLKAEAQAIVFPILLHEVAKVAMELILLNWVQKIIQQHGETVHKATMKRADIFTQEIWMKRIGPTLWNYLHGILNFVAEERGNREMVPYVLYSIC
jgi:hypothetical protein